MSLLLACDRCHKPILEKSKQADDDYLAFAAILGGSTICSYEDLCPSCIEDIKTGLQRLMLVQNEQPTPKATHEPEIDEVIDIESVEQPIESIEMEESHTYPIEHEETDPVPNQVGYNEFAERVVKHIPIT